MMTVEVQTFQMAEEAIRMVRDAVFGQEQGVSPDINWDGHDADCFHVLAQDETGSPLGTGRLLANGKIGRLAVLPEHRGAGIGGALVEKLLELAGERGLREVHLHAQVHALSFYEKRGFQVRGDLFLEAGIEHRHMVRVVGSGGS